MTRSVEIPEEAVEAAALAMFADEHCDKRQMLDVRGNWDARLNADDQALYRSMARASLTAALPYLAPAAFDGHEPGDCLWPDTLGRCPHWAERRSAAPAGDGGLREALEKLATEWPQSADEDERYLNRAHASEIHDVYASIRINRENADALLAVLAGEQAPLRGE